MQQKSKIYQIIKVVLGAVFFAVSIMLFCLYRQANIETGNELFAMADSLTEGFAVRQVAFNGIVFTCGYVMCRGIANWLTKVESFFLSPVVSTSVIGSIIMFMAFTGVPINTVTVSVILLFVFGLTLFLCIRSQKTSWITFFDTDLVLVLFLFFGLSTVFTSGIMPNFMSHDSYYYIMQYGEIIGQTGHLTFDSAGTFMTWTGVSPATMSTLAVLYGFETILANHYLLIFAMLCMMAYSMYKLCVNQYSMGKIVSVVIAVVTGIVIYMLPPVMLLSSWVISNSYNMVWFVALVYLIERLDTHNAVEDDISMNGQLGITWIISMMLVWMAMSRAEGIVLVCMMIVAFTGLRNLSKRQYLFFTGFCGLFQIVFLLKLFFEQKNSQVSVEGTQITRFVAAVMVLAIVAVCLYVVLMDKGIFAIIRRCIGVLLPISLCVGIACSAIMKHELLLNNLNCTVYNITTQFWYYIPALLGILSICLMICNKMKLNFVSLMLIDIVLSNFLITMFRFNPLRLGYGDSFNRLLMSIVPLWIFALTTGLYQNTNKETEENEGERSETDNSNPML